MTPKIAEEIGKYFLEMANKKRNKDDIDPHIKINIEDILDNDLAIPEYLEELSKNLN